MRRWRWAAGLALMLAVGCSAPPRVGAPTPQTKMEELKPLPKTGSAGPVEPSPVAPKPVEPPTEAPVTPKPMPVPLADKHHDEKHAGASHLHASVPDTEAHAGADTGANSGLGGDPDELALDASMQKLQDGKLAYSTPVSMMTGDSATVVARIGGSAVSADALTAGMPQQPGSTVATATTKVSTKMKMALRSADFDITTLSSEEQAIGGSDPTEWQWTIAPKHSGKLQLHLVATVELKDLQRDFASIDRDIQVQVNEKGAVKSFIEKNWQWLYATLGAGLLALVRFLWARRKKADGQGSAKP